MEREAGSLKVERPRRSLREMAQDAVREAILDFRFAPGERLTERTLCDELGVSRTVVREVLRYLEAEGLVEVTPNKGPVVARIRPDEAGQIYELRSLLESMAARDCARLASEEDLGRLGGIIADLRQARDRGAPHDQLRTTTAFYREMFIIAGKRIAWEMVETLNVRINALRAMTISRPARRAEAADEVCALFDAISRRDPDAAARISAEHVARAAAIAQDVLQEIRSDDDAMANRLGEFTGAR